MEVKIFKVNGEKSAIPNNGKTQLPTDATDVLELNDSTFQGFSVHDLEWDSEGITSYGNAGTIIKKQDELRDYHHSVENENVDHGWQIKMLAIVCDSLLNPDDADKQARAIKAVAMLEHVNTFWMDYYTKKAQLTPTSGSPQPTSAPPYDPKTI